MSMENNAFAGILQLRWQTEQRINKQKKKAWSRRAVESDVDCVCA